MLNILVLKELSCVDPNGGRIFSSPQTAQRWVKQASSDDTQEFCRQYFTLGIALIEQPCVVVTAQGERTASVPLLAWHKM